MQSMCWHLKSLYFFFKLNCKLSRTGYARERWFVTGGTFFKLEIWGMRGGGVVFLVSEIFVFESKKNCINLIWENWSLSHRLIIKESLRYLKFHNVTKTYFLINLFFVFRMSSNYFTQWDPLNSVRGRWLKDSSYDFELSKNMK